MAMGKMYIDLSKRVESKCPPIVFRPKLPRDLGEFNTVNDLILRQVESRTKFPFQRELALYLLLIASIWPRDAKRLLAAARIFSGALNFHMSRRDSTVVRKHSSFYRALTSEKLDRFNKLFFAKIGGQDSLLFCQGSEEFHCAVWARINELAMMHDVIEFLVKTAGYVPEFCSSKFAFRAVAHNVFGRKGGYGVAVGLKRAQLSKELVTTPETIRAKWKNAPDTILLSFVLTRWYGFHYFDPSSAMFLKRLNEAVRNGSRDKLMNVLSIIQERLNLGKAKQNTSISKWLRTDIPRLQQPLYFNPLSPSELEHMIGISRAYFSKPLTPDRETELRETVQTWWRQIPRTP